MPFRRLAPFVLFSIALPASQSDHVLLTFSATENTKQFHARLPNGLRVEVEKDGPDWQLYVFKGSSDDSLLYPSRRWHGAWPCQLSAWSHKRKTFPDIRIIPIRGYQMSLVVDLSKAQSSGDQDNEVYTGGTITISWRRGA